MECVNPERSNCELFLLGEIIITIPFNSDLSLKTMNYDIDLHWYMNVPQKDFNMSLQPLT